MSERYSTVFSLSSHFYLEGSPVLIEAGAIRKDEQTNNLLVQLKLRNISSKTIIACKVKINAYSVSGDQLEGVNSFSYLDLRVVSGVCFGTKTPIYLPNYETRRFTVCITQVVFADNSLWNADAIEWKQISDPEKIEDKLFDDSKIHDGELVKQYKLDVGEKSDYYPEIKDGLFYCTCGSINMDSVERCYSCKREYSNLARILEDGYLTSRKESRLAHEAKERRVKMQQEADARAAELQKRQKRKERTGRFLKIAIPIVVALVLAYIFAPKFYGYYRGKNLYDNGNYQKAADEFEPLNGFLDSEEYLIQSQYMIAMSAYENGLYTQALEEFEELGDYSDSANNVLQCRYMLASEAYNNGDYATAINIFHSLGDYSDSSQKYNELLNESEYFLNLIHQSVYEAYTILSNIDSNNPEIAELLDICNQYIPYCGDYEWTIEGHTYSFNSDFSIDEDGTVYWHYNADNYGPILGGQNSFIDTWEVHNGHVSNSLEDFDDYQDFCVIVYFRDGQLYTKSSYYLSGVARRIGTDSFYGSSPFMTNPVYARRVNE